MELEDQDLLPSLNSFHRYLCSLDYYTDFKDKLNTVNNSVETKDEEGAPVAAVGEKIKLKFESPWDYIKEWEEMFLIEAKAQIIRGGITEKLDTDEFLLKNIEPNDSFFIMTLQCKQNKGNAYRIYDFVIFAKEEVHDKLNHRSKNPRTLT